MERAWSGYKEGMHLIAAAQMVSTADKAHNLDSATRLVRRAADLGARLVGLPENFSWMGPDRKSTRLNSSHSGESRMPSSA